ncbi:unnamed protein product [Mytilus edulis]|uniref:Reverse transcriptase domain-containing protein n=1 Tax=Mytilus edulis TaxID=6550 RepID=A0A8S3QS24_MYTED|nr:unnamed protein product [Mytilus edulis]
MGLVSRRPSGQPQYDPALKENWTLLRLRQEVTRLKLKVPKNAKRLTVVRILNSVEDSSHSDNTTETVDISDIADEANTIYGGARSHNAPVRIQEDHVAPTNGTSSNEGRTLINLVSRLSSTVQSLQQNVSALNRKVNSLLVVQPNTRQEEVAVPTFTSTGSGHSEDINNSGNSHNLESAYASLNRTTIPAAAAGSANQEARSVRTSRGYSAETLPFVETISPQLRKNIISGLDINLTSLLIPYYVGSGTSEMFDGDDKNYKTDPRLTRSLSIGEFIQAFTPHENADHPSLNELIDKEEFSLQYVTIDDAIHLIKKLGSKSWLIKTDITDAFKIMPLKQDLWPFHGIQWDNKFYFFKRLVFGCRSSPKIFDTLSTAICWIAQNKYGIKNILHLLDDFLVIEPLEANAQATMTRLLNMFKELGIPLSAKKTEGPCVVLEYLDISLDTNKMEARLPREKIVRIKEIIDSFNGEISKAGTKSRSDTHTLPSSSSFDDGLIKQVEELWEASLCISTRKTYNSGFLCFKTFMAMTNQHHINSVPIIDEDCLIYFVTYCKNSLKLAHATIKLYLAGIRHNYLRIGHPDPLSNCARLECILRGIKKSQNNVKQKRLPITSQILKQLCCMLQQGVFSPFVDLMLQCSFNLAFFGFLRCGEFTYSSKIARQDTLLIQNIDFDLNFQNFTVHLNSSKCDPFREGINITIFENDIFSPVDLMRRYIQVRKNHGARPDSYLFVNDEYNNAPLSRDTFIARLRESLFRLGYNDSKFCGHSFRIGAATSAAAAGVEDHIIQTLGRWSSDCYIRYIRTDPKTVCKAQSRMCCS